MKYIAYTALVYVLIGCTTPAGIREKPPIDQYQSSKSEKVVAMCIADKWESNGIFGSTLPVSMRPIAKGHTVSLSATGNTLLLVDVEDAQSGSKTSYFKGIVWGEASFDEIVKNCQ